MTYSSTTVDTNVYNRGHVTYMTYSVSEQPGKKTVCPICHMSILSFINLIISIGIGAFAITLATNPDLYSFQFSSYGIWMLIVISFIMTFISILIWVSAIVYTSCFSKTILITLGFIMAIFCVGEFTSVIAGSIWYADVYNNFTLFRNETNFLFNETVSELYRDCCIQNATLRSDLCHVITEETNTTQILKKECASYILFYNLVLEWIQPIFHWIVISFGILGVYHLIVAVCACYLGFLKKKLVYYRPVEGSVDNLLGYN